MTEDAKKTETPKATEPKVTKADQDAREYFETFRRVPPGYRYNVYKGVYKAKGK